MRYVFTLTLWKTTEIKDEYGSVILRLSMERPDSFVGIVKSHVISTPAGQEVARVSNTPGFSLFSSAMMITRPGHGAVTIAKRGWFRTRFAITTTDGAFLTLTRVIRRRGQARYVLTRDGTTIATILNRPGRFATDDMEADINDEEDVPLVVACMRAVTLLAPPNTKPLGGH